MSTPNPSRDTVERVRAALSTPATVPGILRSTGLSRPSVYKALDYLHAEKDAEFYPPTFRLPAA